MPRDLRDPQQLGEEIIALRAETHRKHKTTDVVDRYPHALEAVPDYDDLGMISNDPAQHHSRTRQDIPVVSDGGA
jgi:hypothetical protein